MTSEVEPVGPVAIGGLGGSGTRLIASMVSALGYRPGNDLNWADDDLAFTVLFKRPSLYPGTKGLIPAGHPAAVTAARTFAGLRTSGRPTTSDRAAYLRACGAVPFSHARPVPPRRATWAATRARHGLYPHPAPEPGLWTWKEPNTLLFLPTLFGEIPGLRYIHVVRNGLSMAKSKNLNQLFNWGDRFDLSFDVPDLELQQLVYWARANLAVSDFLATQTRSLVVTHEETVADAAAVLGRIADFLQRTVTEESRAVVDRVRRPADFDRSFQVPELDLPTGQQADIEGALARFGYGEGRE